jgi:hypothetical protein
MSRSTVAARAQGDDVLEVEQASALGYGDNVVSFELLGRAALAAPVPVARPSGEGELLPRFAAARSARWLVRSPSP